METVEQLFRMDEWDRKPVSYAVVSRTARTFMVRQHEGRPEWRVNAADIGQKWFLTERDAWNKRCETLSWKVDRLKLDWARAVSDLEDATAAMKAVTIESVTSDATA